MEREEFTARLVKLRMNKGVSARDMSLSLGQSENYINEIENGKAYPSMQAFFYICDYFNITPQEFFDTGRPDPNGSNFLIQRLKGLSPEKLRIISTMIDSWDKWRDRHVLSRHLLYRHNANEDIENLLFDAWKLTELAL